MADVVLAVFCKVVLQYEQNMKVNSRLNEAL